MYFLKISVHFWIHDSFIDCLIEDFLFLFAGVMGIWMVLEDVGEVLEICDFLVICLWRVVVAFT